MTRAQVVDAFDDSFSSEPRLILYQGPISQRLRQTIEICYSAKGIHCFSAILEKRKQYFHADECFQSTVLYNLLELQSLSGFDLTLAMLRSVSASTVPAQITYPKSRLYDAVSIDPCDNDGHGGTFMSFKDKVGG